MYVKKRDKRVQEYRVGHCYWQVAGERGTIMVDLPALLFAAATTRTARGGEEEESSREESRRSSKETGVSTALPSAGLHC